MNFKSLLRFRCQALAAFLVLFAGAPVMAADECGDADFGKMKRENNRTYVCDQGIGVWREATKMEIALAKSCTKKNLDEKTKVKDIDITCTDDGWEGYFVDSRDKRKYAVSLIDKQIWMKENLDYEKMFGIDCKQCDGYHIYDFGDAQKVCPKGWRLPSIDEWSFIEKNGGLVTVANTGAFWSSTKVTEATTIKQGLAADIRWRWVGDEMEKTQKFFVLQQPLPRKNGYPVRCMMDNK